MPTLSRPGRILVVELSDAPAPWLDDLRASAFAGELRTAAGASEAQESARASVPELLILHARCVDEEVLAACRSLRESGAALVVVTDGRGEPTGVEPPVADAALASPSPGMLRTVVGALLRATRPEARAAARDDRLALEAVMDRLRQKEADLVNAQRIAHIGSWQWDLVSDAVAGSEELLRIFGLDPTRQSAPPFADQRGRFYSEAEWDRLNAVVQSTLETGEPYELELQAIRDGTPIRITTRGEVVRDARGRVTGLRGTVEDVTERRRADEALHQREVQFQALIENVSSAVALVDAAGRFTLYNRQFLSMFGLSPDSDVVNVNAQDWRAWQVFDESGRLLDVDAHPVRRAALTRLPVRNQLVGVRSPSARALVWMLVSAEPLLGADGAIEHLICTFHDVTERRRAEERLRLANEQLREADRRKNEFLAVLSHELRNPLAPIRNSVYILAHAEPGGEQARRAQEVIDRQAAQLTRLVDDLLEITRITQGKIRLQREVLDFSALVRRCVEDHRQMFANAGVGLELEEETAGERLFVDGDPARLAQVVGNLLSNAVKFTPTGGRARLVLDVEPGGQARLRVCDTGVGLAPELLDRMFEPFVQGETTLDRTRGGLGLGLAVLKGFVVLHGGTVGAHSTGPGRGAEFSITLPVAHTEPDGPAPARRGPRREERKHVLVIEDNADAAESLRAVLELQGHVVSLAGTGPEGIEKARASRPDVVLCDIGLPGMDGFEVGRALRADPELASTTLVALSGYALPEDVERALQAGFDRHLAKPVDPDELFGG